MLLKKDSQPCNGKGNDKTNAQNDDFEQNAKKPRFSFKRKNARCCEKCGSELESTRNSSLCEACEREQLQNNLKKGGMAGTVIAIGIAAAKKVAPRVAPYAKKATLVIASAIKKIVLR